jgi:hypothetical protein
VRMALGGGGFEHAHTFGAAADVFCRNSGTIEPRRPLAIETQKVLKSIEILAASRVGRMKTLYSCAHKRAHASYVPDQ